MVKKVWSEKEKFHIFFCLYYCRPARMSCNMILIRIGLAICRVGSKKHCILVQLNKLFEHLCSHELKHFYFDKNAVFSQIRLYIVGMFWLESKFMTSEWTAAAAVENRMCRKHFQLVFRKGVGLCTYIVLTFANRANI